MNINNQEQQLKINMRTATRCALSAFALTTILLQAACVSNISSATKESDKNTTGALDGQWMAEVRSSAGKQYMPGNWYMRCSGKSWEFPIYVKDGIAGVRFNGKKKDAFVSTTGNFRFDIPLEHGLKVVPGSPAQIGNDRASRIIYGNLYKAKGRYTHAIAEFGNSGCTATIDFVRKNKAT